jgi:Flp pilus assembly protein protease CpaA
LIGVALVIGVLAVVGFAWKNDRLQLASAEAPMIRTTPVPPELPPLP